MSERSSVPCDECVHDKPSAPNSREDSIQLGASASSHAFAHDCPSTPYSQDTSNQIMSTSSRSDFSLHPLPSRHRRSMSLDIDIYGHVRDDLHQTDRYLRCTPSTDSLLALLDKTHAKLHPAAVSPRFSSMDTLVDAKWIKADGTDVFKRYPALCQASDGWKAVQNIHEIFDELQLCFGFQNDGLRNALDHLLVLLDSRASRMTVNQAIITLHADFIGGPNANFKKWWFSVALDDHDATFDPEERQRAWVARVSQLIHSERLSDLALWLLIWTEASVLRFCPEFLCFLFFLARDHLQYVQKGTTIPPAPALDFLTRIVTPLYDYIHHQNATREKDHANVIGYDDINQFFWSSSCIRQLKANDEALMSLHPSLRYAALAHINWHKVFTKTFKERRSWMHLIVNFTRIWALHIAAFWYYIIPNASVLYSRGATQAESSAPDGYNATNDAELPVVLSMTALGGAIATLIVIVGVVAEHAFLPMQWKDIGILARRILSLVALFLVNAGPSVYCLYWSRVGTIATLVSVVQLMISIVTTLVLVLAPHGFYFGKRSVDSTDTFSSNFATLSRKDRIMSIGLWLCVFGSKLIESYFFLALSFKDALNYVAVMDLNCSDGAAAHPSSFISKIEGYVCDYMPWTTAAMMFLVELVLFFLDTYLWYVVWNTIFSVVRSFYLGISIMTPWKNIFARLQKRIYTKLLATADTDIQCHPKVLCSQVWNAIIIAMYREHILSSKHVTKLLFQQKPDLLKNGKKHLKPPAFFVSQEDSSLTTEFYPPESEAERRIQFLAQSLTSPMPNAMPVPQMPTFTVLTPHYNEKILLSLQEIIRQDHKKSHVTLLEYLQHLHPFEWDNFVNDTKVMAEQLDRPDDGFLADDHDDELLETVDYQRSDACHADDVPFYCLGFKSAAPEFTLRTRIWASLRSQTLYRTITGFMNYHRAIKLLYRTETPDLMHQEQQDVNDTLHQMATRKFRFLIAMQRYASLNSEERESIELILGIYPDLQIAYIEKDVDSSTGATRFYSCLIDGHCPRRQQLRVPKYRIQLPGNPILGDGKSDNQNTALIFYRGEYLQLIDANQDNYLEECLKIRSVLGEFENLNANADAIHAPYTTASHNGPVAIVGAREYIFSEKTGVLGDIAAGKEQTFGTMTQRIMATIGGKLHYGHPDFLNAVFMTTRGGVSKGQKGLHLNEDIFMGMNAFQRGGRIKHVDYYQCAKGRDLGFCSILNFVTKIGSGMGEQMLSREYYHLGTRLPLDRFLTFFYAHPGFHINNVFIMLAIRLFLLVVLLLTAIQWSCDGNCTYHLFTVYGWIKNVVLSIFVVLVISLVPLFMQELTERGFWRAVTRLCKHLVSLSPLFEIFVTQTYAHAILDNLTFGGARYIGSGRGFAIARQNFTTLYMQFADVSLYRGLEFALPLLFASMVIWLPHMIYFWMTVVAMIMSPFVFNPHQFALVDSLVDYKQVMQWLFFGYNSNDEPTWTALQRVNRMKYTGQKREKVQLDHPRPARLVLLFTEIIAPAIYAGLCLFVYLFAHRKSVMEQPQSQRMSVHLFIRIGLPLVLPSVVNVIALLALFAMSLLVGPIISMISHKHVRSFGNLMSTLAHLVSIVSFVASLCCIYLMEQWQLRHAVLALIVVMAIQRVLSNLVTMLLTREFRDGLPNFCWWTGCWIGQGLGWHAISQPWREFVCKVLEMGHFAYDFLIVHVIFFVLIVLAFFRFVDKYHTLMLFWTMPGNQNFSRVRTTRQRKERRKTAILYGILYFITALCILAVLVLPVFLGPRLFPNLSMPQ